MAIGVCAGPLLAQDEDSPSLGDAARQARQQKQQRDADAGKSAAANAAATNATATDAQNGALNKDAAGRPSPKDQPAKGAQAKGAAANGVPANNAPANNAPPLKAKKVITNDEIPEHVGPTQTSAPGYQVPGQNYQPPANADGKMPADYWKGQIQGIKAYIASMQEQIKTLSDSIQYAGGNCVSNCVHWNERQQQKQQQVEGMKSQLEEQQKRLEDMQEAARRQGYGTSVYDP